MLCLCKPCALISWRREAKDIFFPVMLNKNKKNSNARWAKGKVHCCHGKPLQLIISLPWKVSAYWPSCDLWAPWLLFFLLRPKTVLLLRSPSHVCIGFRYKKRLPTYSVLFKCFHFAERGWQPHRFGALPLSLSQFPQLIFTIWLNELHCFTFFQEARLQLLILYKRPARRCYNLACPHLLGQSGNLILHQNVKKLSCCCFRR